MLARRSGSRAAPGELSMAHMPKWKRCSSSESALSPTLESSDSRRYPQIMQAYSHQHVHICKRFHCRVSVARHDLISDTPNAAPRIVDVVADSPRVADLRVHRPVFPTGKHNAGYRDLPPPVQQPCAGSVPATATQLRTSRPLWYSTSSINYQTFLQVNLSSPRRSQEYEQEEEKRNLLQTFLTLLGKTPRINPFKSRARRQIRAPTLQIPGPRIQLKR
jgi:hypothetical protein